jgi:hypothetical protein
LTESAGKYLSSSFLKFGSETIQPHAMHLICPRYAIAEEKMLIEAADKLEQFHPFNQQKTETAK